MRRRRIVGRSRMNSTLHIFVRNVTNRVSNTMRSSDSQVHHLVGRKHHSRSDQVSGTKIAHYTKYDRNFNIIKRTYTRIETKKRENTEMKVEIKTMR